MTDVTRILDQIQQGDPSAAEQLLPLVYMELRKLAAHKLAQEKSAHTLQATALVHEAYIRLVDVNHVHNWDGRGHFFAAAGRATILVSELLTRGDFMPTSYSTPERGQNVTGNSVNLAECRLRATSLRAHPTKRIAGLKPDENPRTRPKDVDGMLPTVRSATVGYPKSSGNYSRFAGRNLIGPTAPVPGTAAARKPGPAFGGCLRLSVGQKAAAVSTDLTTLRLRRTRVQGASGDP